MVVVDDILRFMVQQALTRVLSLITEELKLVWGLDEELKSLRDSLATVNDLLQDAEEQQKTQKVVSCWLKKVKNWAYDAEDVHDDLACEILRGKVDIQNPVDTKVPKFLKFSKGFHFVRKTAFHIKMARKVKHVSEALDKIKSEAFGFGLRVISADAKSQIGWDRVTDSIVDHPVVARDDEVSQIVNLVAGSSGQQGLTIVGIVGMAGLGKTTVAKLVCQKAIARKLFDVKMWVCVSTDFDEKRILEEMLQTLDENAGGITNKDAIIQHLEMKLQRKSFLLVLDDVWNQGSERWESLKSRLLLISKNNRNAVVVTTRSEGVALLMETSPQCRHKLKLLSDAECWSIINQRVSGNSQASIPSDLVNIGKEIAKKCRGLPLAARVLGGTMRGSIEKEAWLTIKDSDILNVSEHEVSIESILRLSFDQLPFHLKPCFAYCSMFPKSIRIGKQELIALWMAQGLLELPMEDTGEKYFKQFLLSSFLQEGKCDEFGNITSARMHDLVHDLALSISKFETLNWETCSVANDLSHIQHLNIIPDEMPGAPIPIFSQNEAQKLRSLFTANAQVSFTAHGSSGACEL